MAAIRAMDHAQRGEGIQRQRRTAALEFAFSGLTGNGQPLTLWGEGVKRTPDRGPETA